VVTTFYMWVLAETFRWVEVEMSDGTIRIRPRKEGVIAVRLRQIVKQQFLSSHQGIEMSHGRSWRSIPSTLISDAHRVEVPDVPADLASLLDVGPYIRVHDVLSSCPPLTHSLNYHRSFEIKHGSAPLNRASSRSVSNVDGPPGIAS
jgi:hypothetical protein